VVKNGKTGYGKQLFLCKQCGAQFVRQYWSRKRQGSLFEEYVFGKQTLKQLAEKHGRTIKTIQKYLDHYQKRESGGKTAQPVVVGIDCSFFGRGYGIIVARCPNLKQNLYWKEITTENKAVYEEVRRHLEKTGYNLQAIVIDAKHGIKEVFQGLVIQICQYHQQQIVQRYLTAKPKTQAGQELKGIANSLTEQDESPFAEALKEWRMKWRKLLTERTYASDGKRWWYTHKRLRSAYRSLNTNLPYLFSYKKYPELNIPNTNNSLEGYFSKLKQLLNNHHGLKCWRRYRLIETVLNN
jgi:DNA-binding transcriptional MerR regulator